MKDWMKTLASGAVSVVGWILVVMISGFVLRVNYEVFMMGWGFIK